MGEEVDHEICPVFANSVILKQQLLFICENDGVRGGVKKLV